MKIKDKEVNASCKIGGETCIYLTHFKGSWDCVKGTEVGDIMFARYKQGKTTAKGLGDWVSCKYRKIVLGKGGE